MPLQGEQLRRRILAAAALQGLGMRGVRDVLEQFGANKTLAEQMIRGEQSQNDRNLRDLSDVLHVPVEWFTVPDLEEWLATRPSEGGQFERGELHAEVYEIRQLLSHVQDRLRHFDPTGETIGNG